MKIAIDIRHLTNPNPSGVGQYTTELLNALFDLDKNNEYILFSSGSKRTRANLPIFDYPNVKKVQINLPNRLINTSLLVTGQPRFDRLAIDILDLKERPLFFFPNLNIISVSPSTPYVLTLHDLSFEIFPNLFDRKSRLWHRFTKARELAQNAEAIIVPSKSTARDVQNIFKVAEEKIHVVPHGIDPKFSAKPEAQDHGLKSRYQLPKRFALFVGTLEPRKNLQTVVEAVVAYRQKTKDDLHLILVGKTTSYSRKILKKLSSAQKNFIHELGYVRNQDRPALYRLATVTLFPSLYEGFGLPIIESMACGTPVITSNTSAMPEVANQAAICVDPYNTADLISAMQELLFSEELRKQKISAGLAQAKNFNWKKTAEETLKIFNESSPRPPLLTPLRWASLGQEGEGLE